MADVDDELLALVGGDESSDEEASEQAMNISESGSESDAEPQHKKESRKSAPKRAHKRKHGYSEEEEGEASSGASSPASQQSAPMDESDSEAGSPAVNETNGAALDDENKYPFEGLFASEQEKEDIMSMREVERETLLAERMQEIERQRQNRLLRQLVSQGEHEKKRKAQDAGLGEEAHRKTSRQRTKLGGSKVGETSAGIESLRRARAEKSDRQRRLAEDRERNKDKHTTNRHDSSDRDADGDSDVEWGSHPRRRSRSRTPEKKEIPLGDLRDIERIRLSRSRFAKICFFPGFEEAITGCFVRISIGPDPRAPENGNVYRMAVIKRFSTGKPYAMEKGNGHSFVTDQYVVAAHGKAEREWPFIACSDSAFTETEFNRYKATLQSEGLHFPKKPHLENKIDDINGLLNRAWTDHELNEKLLRERNLKLKYTPAERNHIVDAIEQAKRRGDDAQVAELEDKLSTLEMPRLAFKTTLTPSKKSTTPAVSQQDRLAQLNIENRRRNAEAVRKAQLKEKARIREHEMRIGRSESVEADLSQKPRTHAKLAVEANGSSQGKSTPLSGTPTPTNGTPKVEATTKAPVLPNIAKLQEQKNGNGTDKKGIPQIHRPLMDDDIIGAIDLGIDEDIEL